MREYGGLVGLHHSLRDHSKEWSKRSSDQWFSTWSTWSSCSAQKSGLTYVQYMAVHVVSA